MLCQDHFDRKRKENLPENVWLSETLIRTRKAAALPYLTCVMLLSKACSPGGLLVSRHWLGLGEIWAFSPRWEQWCWKEHRQALN